MAAASWWPCRAAGAVPWRPAAWGVARAWLLGLCLVGSVTVSAAWELAGPKAVVLHSRDGQSREIGQVVFTPQADGRTAFRLVMATERFQDFFLSMREFKCLEGQEEVFCHVPYPYAQPGTVTARDFAWLEHALLFMFKRPGEFGAKLWNGVYWSLSATPGGLVGRAQAVDLNRIGAPPERLDVPPFKPAVRDDIPVDARWFHRLTIE